MEGRVEHADVPKPVALRTCDPPPQTPLPLHTVAQAGEPAHRAAFSGVLS